MGKNKSHEISEVSSTSSFSSPAKSNQDELLKDNEKVPQKEILLPNYDYKDLLIKSVFNYIDFKLITEIFEDWYIKLKRHLITHDYYRYIDEVFVFDEMTRKQIKYDNAVQTIVAGSLNTEYKKIFKRL